MASEGERDADRLAPRRRLFSLAVVVDNSAPEVAEALRERLGDRVVVTLGKPRRHALGAAPR